MKQAQWIHGEALKIGLLLSAGVILLALLIRPDSWSFTIFGVNAMLIVSLFGITGALFGRLLSRTRKGAWLGAAIALFILFLWMYTIAANAPLE